MEQQGEIILYQPDESVRMEVRIEDETVWLTQAQIVELFQSSKANISEHLKNIYKSEELIQSSTVRNFRTVRQEGNRQITRNLEYYNLDVIISVGYRVNTKRGIQFRQWANSQAHDRFLIIDQSDVYHIGTSLKDLGKKLFVKRIKKCNPDAANVDEHHWVRPFPQTFLDAIENKTEFTQNTGYK